jgi:hypothetical protein
LLHQKFIAHLIPVGVEPRAAFMEVAVTSTADVDVIPGTEEVSVIFGRAGLSSCASHAYYFSRMILVATALNTNSFPSVFITLSNETSMVAWTTTSSPSPTNMGVSFA